MVRIKHRYLLVKILYPEPTTAPPLAKSTSIPSIIQFNHPTPDDLTPQHFLRALREQASVLYGDYGSGVLSGQLAVKYFSPATSTLIIRCPRAHYRLAWAVLTFMTRLPPTRSPQDKQQQHEAQQSRPCAMRVVRVSGTIRKAEQAAIMMARRDILRAKPETLGSGEEVDGLLARLGGERLGKDGIEYPDPDTDSSGNEHEDM